MRPQLSCEEKLRGHCYLRLEDGESEKAIQTDLLGKGFEQSELDVAIDWAKDELAAFARHRNLQLMKTLGAAAAIAIFGAYLASQSDSAPNRFAGLHWKVWLLAMALAGYGFWSRSQRR